MGESSQFVSQSFLSSCPEKFVYYGEGIKRSRTFDNTTLMWYIHAKKAIVMILLPPRYSTNAGARPEILYNSPVFPGSLKGLRSPTRGQVLPFRLK